MKCNECGLERIGHESFPYNDGSTVHLCVEALKEKLSEMKNMRDLLSSKLQEKIRENELLKAWRYNIRHTVLGDK